MNEWIEKRDIQMMLVDDKSTLFTQLNQDEKIVYIFGILKHTDFWITWKKYYNSWKIVYIYYHSERMRYFRFFFFDCMFMLLSHLIVLEVGYIAKPEKNIWTTTIENNNKKEEKKCQKVYYKIIYMEHVTRINNKGEIERKKNQIIKSYI